MLFVKPPNLILCYGTLSRLIQFICWIFCCCCLFALVVAVWIATLYPLPCFQMVMIFIWLSTYPQTANLIQDGTNGSGAKIHNFIPCPPCGSRTDMWLKWDWTKSSLGCVYKGWRNDPWWTGSVGISIRTEWKSSLLQHERKVCLWVKPISAWASDQAISRAWYLLCDGILIVQGNCKMPN